MWKTTQLAVSSSPSDLLRHEEDELRPSGMTGESSSSGPPLPRPVVIDACNVAKTHAGPSRSYFSCLGILLCVRHFIQQGHRVATFIPFHYKDPRRDDVCDRDILTELHEKDILAFTPVRRVADSSVKSYDDLFIIKCAKDLGAVVISNDSYSDVLKEYPEWADVIVERKLQVKWGKNRGTSPDVFKYDEFGSHRIRNLDKVLRCPFGSPDYHLVQQKQLTPESRKQMLAEINKLLGDIANRTPKPPTETVRFRPRNQESEDPPSAGFERLPASFFLKNPDDKASTTIRKTEDPPVPGFERLPAKFFLRNPDDKASTTGATASFCNSQKCRSGFGSPSFLSSQVQSSSCNNASLPACGQKVSPVATSTSVDQMKEVSNGQPFRGTIHTPPSVSFGCGQIVPSPFPHRMEKPETDQMEEISAEAHSSGEVKDEDTNKMETNICSKNTQAGSVRVSSLDFMSDSDFALFSKLVHTFDPSAIVHAMKDYPDIRSVSGLANQILDDI